ncbi:aldehyde dehydrogenase family protein [Stigmatella sp. ncwal1]|uniref:Aldehyde dehydrogenase n=1 Tax=Stigmatella ashevillensis TaxID=2995309 RepID=A0ABT5DD75_9BACT|nr:aldehyde dehydrogenase family protein [Stigmatella ashevillena]MDC0711080.1 aldehyde dehydrogenase family protein [Stigmatella ashevillena]
MIENVKTASSQSIPFPMVAPVPKVEAVPEDFVDPKRVREVFEAQRAHRWTMSRTTAAERIARLLKLKTAILERREALTAAIHADFRKPGTEVNISEIQAVIGELNHTVKHLKSWMKPTRVGTPPLLAGTTSQIRPEAKGVVLIISPWNYPFALAINPLIAALAAGNCVVLKPSEKTPHTAAFLETLIGDVFEEREVTLLRGGAALGDALLEQPFDHFFFTGNPRIGQRVMAAAARHLAGVTLELGGKSPVIVDATADVKAAAERIMWGKCINAGQTCIAPDYIFVHASREKEFLEHAKQALTAFYGAEEKARQESPDFARLVDNGAFRRIQDLIARSVSAGAKLEVGGQADEAARYVAPTLLSGVRPDMAVMEGEIFGPVLPVMTFQRLDEVVEHIHAGGKPLALYIFSEDSKNIEEILQRTTSGGVVVNNVLLHFINPNLPFGGVGLSGLGSYHGHHGFRTFSHERSVLTQTLPSAASVFFPPYTGKGLKGLAARLSRWLE